MLLHHVDQKENRVKRRLPVQIRFINFFSNLKQSVVFEPAATGLPPSPAAAGCSHAMEGWTVESCLIPMFTHECNLIRTVQKILANLRL